MKIRTLMILSVVANILFWGGLVLMAPSAIKALAKAFEEGRIEAQDTKQ